MIFQTDEKLTISIRNVAYLSKRMVSLVDGRINTGQRQTVLDINEALLQLVDTV